MSVSLLHGVRRTPFFCWARAVSALAIVIGLLVEVEAVAAQPQAVRLHAVAGVAYDDAKDALTEAIEADGLVISHHSALAAMLARTAGDLGHKQLIYKNGETLHFCNVSAAWALAKESPANIALCPMGISVYETAADPGRIVFAYRPMGGSSQGARMADQLMEKLVRKAIKLLQP